MAYNSAISDARLRILIPPGYLPAPHCLSRCNRSRHTLNFNAIGASHGPESGQHSSFKSFQSRRRGMIHGHYQTRLSLIPQLPPTMTHKLYLLRTGYLSEHSLYYLVYPSVAFHLHDTPYSCNSQILLIVYLLDG